MREQELRDQIAALFRCAPGEQRLGDEPPGPIADAVLELVGPLLAEKDAEARSLAKSWDQRLSDVQAEYVKHLESWDRQRKRLDADRALLRWLHAEAVWLGQGAEDALRRECARLRREVEFEANALEAGADYLGFDEPRRACACVTDEAAEVIRAGGFSRPVCAVHPEAREEGEERSGRDVSGQASREETPGNVSSRRLTTSGVPGPGDGTATPAPPSSRPSPSVHPGEKP